MADDREQRQTILDALALCDTVTLRRLEALVRGAGDSAADSASRYLSYLNEVVESDISGLKNSERSYGNSWKRRGGVDTFHMLTRKWDRMEKRVAKGVEPAAGRIGAAPYDIFEHLSADTQATGLIDDVRDLRRYLMLVEAEIEARRSTGHADSGRGYLDQLEAIGRSDVETIREKERSYGNSWKSRGGISAFMMLARKWDRIGQRVGTGVAPSGEAPGAARDNVFEHIVADRREEGVINDVRDLRQYLTLVEAEMAARGIVQIGTARDNREGT